MFYMPISAQLLSVMDKKKLCYNDDVIYNVMSSNDL